MRAVIIGFGVASFTAATYLRKNSLDAEISVYTDERDLYYPRPRLYQIITGEKGPQDLYSLNAQFYANQRIQTNLQKRVDSINLLRKEVILEDGSRKSWDKLLLAMGAHPFRPAINGLDKKGVFTLRTIVDAVAIRERLKRTPKALVIGAGLLGLECAASLRKTGLPVDVLAKYQRLLPKQLDQSGSDMLINDLQELGINPVLNANTTEILGNDEATGVSLENGKQLDGGLVLIAAGVRGNFDLAANADIKVDKGVIVDQYLETNVSDIYAAGDVIEFNGQVYGIIPPAIEQAKMASLSMLGNREIAYRGTIHTTTLRIAGISLTSMGLVNPEGSKYEEIKKINAEKGIYKKIVLEQGRIVGALFLGEKKGILTIRKLMEQGADVTKYKDRLLEDDFLR